MKWDKAIKQIKFEINNGHDVEITYHRKYYTKWYYCGYVENLQDCGKLVVHGKWGEDFLNKSEWIIDEIRLIKE